MTKTQPPMQAVLPAKQTILIVDDEPGNIESLAMALQDHYELRFAMTGEDALANMKLSPLPGLVLLDIGLPDISGMEICQTIKENPDTKGIPVIFVTGQTSAEDEAAGLQVGAGDFIKKPINAAVVRARVNVHIELKQALVDLEISSRRTARLLNATGQGFLSVNNSLTVGPIYSRACERMFGAAPCGQHIASLLYDEEQHDVLRQDVFVKALTMIFDTQDAFRHDMLIGLLPTEFFRQGRIFKIEYRMDSDSMNLMLVLTDVTEERELQATITINNQRLERVVHVVSDREGFVNLYHKFSGFLETLANTILTEAEPDIALLYRHVHTFKGVFLQYSFEKLPDALHELEDCLRPDQLQSVSFPANIADILRHALDQDLQILFKSLGHDFIEEGGGVWLTDTKYTALEDRLMLLKQQAPILADLPAFDHFTRDWQRLREVPIRSLLLPMLDSLPGLAANLNKQLHPPTLSGGDLRVLPTVLRPLTMTLGHILRNAVIHGLEEAEERLDQGKEELGQIACSIVMTDGALQITISDDGRGINTELIREKAQKQGMLAGIDGKDLSHEQLLLLVFQDNLSTKAVIDQMSGRGVGMSAVKDEVDRIGGRIDIQSIKGEGTTFTILLPSGSWNISRQKPDTKK